MLRRRRVGGAALRCPARRLRRGVWMGVLLLWCAASIILPIIQAEGVLRVFFPYLVRNPQVTPPAWNARDPSAPDEVGTPVCPDC